MRQFIDWKSRNLRSSRFHRASSGTGRDSTQCRLADEVTALSSQSDFDWPLVDRRATDAGRTPCSQSEDCRSTDVADDRIRTTITPPSDRAMSDYCTGDRKIGRTSCRPVCWPCASCTAADSIWKAISKSAVKHSLFCKLIPR